MDEKPLDGQSTPAWKTKKERETYAIISFNKRKDSDSDWSTSYVQINNSKVHTALEKILEGYPNLTQYELKIFQPPYLPFFHRWTEFTQYIEHESDEDTWHYLNLLRNMLLPRLDDTFTRWEEVEGTGHVAFNNLDLAFDPGDFAIRVCNGFRSASVFRRGSFGCTCDGRRFFDAYVDVVDWDGRRCGLLSQTWRVWEYRGLRALTALSVSPLRAHPDKEAIETALISRGRVFEKLRGQFFMAYTDEHEERVNERTVIDARAYHKFSGNSFPRFAKLSEIGRLTWAQSMNRYSSSYDGDVDAPMEIDLTPLTDGQCLLCVPTVKCFNIESKKWGKSIIVPL